MYKNCLLFIFCFFVVSLSGMEERQRAGDFPPELFDLSCELPLGPDLTPGWDAQLTGGHILTRTYYTEFTDVRFAFEAGMLMAQDSCRSPFNAFIKRLQESLKAPAGWYDLVPFLQLKEKIVYENQDEDKELNLTTEHFAKASVPFFWSIDETGRVFIAFAYVQADSIEGFAKNKVIIDYYIRETEHPCRWRNSRHAYVTEKDFQKLADLIYYTMPKSDGGCLHLTTGAYLRLQMPQKALDSIENSNRAFISQLVADLSIKAGYMP